MTPIKAVLFDWGETLVRIPGMIHSPERHLGCLERLFEEGGGENGAPGVRGVVRRQLAAMNAAGMRATRLFLYHDSEGHRLMSHPDIYVVSAEVRRSADQMDVVAQEASSSRAASRA